MHSIAKTPHWGPTAFFSVLLQAGKGGIQLSEGTAEMPRVPLCRQECRCRGCHQDSPHIRELVSVVPYEQPEGTACFGHGPNWACVIKPIWTAPELTLEVDSILEPVPGSDLRQINQDHFA